MRQAIVNTPESIQNAKIQSIVKFSSSLRQLTTLNHLANEFRKTFQQNDTIWPILLRDMNYTNINHKESINLFAH